MTRQRSVERSALVAERAPLLSLAVPHIAHVTIMAMHFGIPIASVPVRTALATTDAVVLVRALKRMAFAEMAYALLFTVGILL